MTSSPAPATAPQMTGSRPVLRVIPAAVAALSSPAPARPAAIPHGLHTPRAVTDLEHDALAPFHHTARNSTGCTMTLDTVSGPGRQPAMGPCLHTSSAADAVAARCGTTGERFGVYKRDLKVVIVGAEGTGKTTLVRSASQSPCVDTDEPRSATSAATGTTTTALDYGRLTLSDGTVLRLFGTPGAPRFSLREDILTGADFAVLLLDPESAKATVPLLNLILERGVPLAVAVRYPSEGPMPPPHSIRSRLGVDDPTSPVLSVDPRDRVSVRRMLADATDKLRRKGIRLTVLRLLASGLTDREIAAQLGEPSPAPVRAHADAICRILHTTSRIHAVAQGVARQLITANHLPHAPAQLPDVDVSDRGLLSLKVRGVADADIAIRLTRSHVSVAASMERLREKFNAASDIELAAHAVLLDAVTCHAVDDRLPNVPLAELRAEGGHAKGDFR